MGSSKNSGIQKIKEAFKTLKESLKELDEIEYLLELLEIELEEYKSLIDKETFIPKAKFVKHRVKRLIERSKFVKASSVLGCIGIKIQLVGELSQPDKHSLEKYIATYLDGHIRAYDMFFVVDDFLYGIIFPLERKEDFNSIRERLKSILLNLKAKTYSDKNVLINFELNPFIIEENETAEEVFKRIKGMG